MKKFLICLLILLCLPQISFAVTAQDQYVDWATGCGGNDGTIGNAYCSCTEWAAQARNLIVEDKIVTVHFIGTGVGSITCTHDGWTTSATQHTILDGLKIQTSNTGSILTLSDDFITLSNFSIERTSAGAINVQTITANNQGVDLEGGFVFCSAGCTRSSGTAGVLMQRGTLWTVTMRNTMIFNIPFTAFEIGTNANMVFNFEGNTFANNTGTGLNLFTDTSTNTTLNLYNNLSTGNTTDYAIGTITTNNHATNISSDTSSPDSSFRSKTITYLGTNNKHLDPTETDAIDQGTTRGTYTVDADGDTRPQGAGYDIGADEVLATSTAGSLTTLKVSGTH